MTKKVSSIAVLTCFLFLICRTANAGIFSFTHTAALMIGQKKASVVAQAEHILKQPKDIVYYFKDAPDEIEARRYSFIEAYDLILFFGKGVFLGLDSIAPNSNDYPRLQHDYKSVNKNTSLTGYILIKNSKKLNLQVLMK